MGVRLVQKTESTTPADHCIGTVFHDVSCFSECFLYFDIFRIHSFYLIFVQVDMETEAAVSTADTDQQISAVFANFGWFTAYYGACGILWHLVASCGILLHLVAVRRL